MDNETENFISTVVFYMIILIIVLLLLYYLYLRNLASRECTFTDNLYGKLNGNIRSLSSSDKNSQYTLKDYYIKTAYNCCSGGSYKNDFVGTCHLKNILKQGVRGLDMEIYSLDGKAVISTSTQDSYFIKETYNSVPFVDVMNILVNYAFSGSTCPNPTDPIILHLRIKSSHQAMYTDLANILKSYNTFLLGKEYSYEYEGKNLGDVPLLSFLGKIVIIVDRNNTAYLENQAFLEYVNMTSNSMFMRALSYYDIANNPDLVELQAFNKRNMTIGMPDKGANPINPNGIVMREAGCQLLAMRYQYVDQYLEENMAFFDKSGLAFVLKPLRLRFQVTTIPDLVEQNPELNYADRIVQSDFYKFNI